MHRVLNIKHRVIRRTGVERAPLATFDVVDLGDEDDNSLAKNNHLGKKSVRQEDTSSKEDRTVVETRLSDVGIRKPETIGGNHSKKALSQAGGEGKEEKGADPPTESKDNSHIPGNEPQCETNPPTEETCVEKEGRSGDKNEELSKSPIKECKEDLVLEDAKKPSAVPPLNSANLTRQGTLGRVSIPIKKQSSVSSSSSSEACNDSHFTFTTSRPSIAHLDSAEGGYDVPDSFSHKGSVSNLVPDNIDPKQILSPSKRKAYEKRLERLKVTTSPIARPRSNAPINVVTLDEYANISSPEHSPLPHSILQDKLKITLPCDEFNRGSKVGNPKRKDSEDTCFEFSEEILFRCTKSALVVDEDGQLPVSPRRVLIPPTITPTNSPKLSSSPRLSADSTGDNFQTQTAPKLIYMKEDDPAHKFFGLTFDEPENENWANFPDSSSVNVEKADTECSEKEVYSNNICGKDQCDLTEQFPDTSDPLDSVNTEHSNDPDVDELESENNVLCAFSDKNTSDSDVKVDSSPEINEVVERFTPANTSENICGDASLGEKGNVEEFLIEDKIETCVENTNEPQIDTLTASLCDKPDSEIVDIPVVDAFKIPTTADYEATRSPTGDALIDLSISTSEPKNHESFLEEGYVCKPSDKTAFHQGHAISTNPFSLCDATTNLDEASVILPIPISSSDFLQPTGTKIQSDSFPSVSLNPFLQDITKESEVVNFSELKDTTFEPAAGKVDSLNPQESHPSFIDLNISSAKSSSPSTDLIDFSSSLDLDFPPPQ